MPVFAVGGCAGGARADTEDADAWNYVDGEAGGEGEAGGDAKMILIKDEVPGATKKGGGEAGDGLIDKMSGGEGGEAMATNSDNSNGTGAHRQGQGGQAHGQVQPRVGKSEIPLFSVRETFRRMF